MKKKRLAGLFVFLLTMLCGAGLALGGEERASVSLNGLWDFNADTLLLSNVVQADDGALSARLPLEGQIYGASLKLTVDCAAKGFFTKALVRVRAYASCDASQGAFLGVRANGGEWVYTDISDYLNGQAHWIPAALNTRDLIKGENLVEVCTTLRGKVYLMGASADNQTIAGIRVQFCAPGDEWTTAAVPAAFETQMDNGLRKLYPGEFDGVGYYKKSIVLGALEPGENWWLHIEASDYRTEVFVNGRFAGSHEGGYTPFDINLTAYPECVLFNEENELVIRVTDQTFGKSDDNDAIYIKETLAGFLQDTRGINYGGLWGDVSLEKRSGVYLESVFFRPDVAAQRVTAVVTLNNSSSSAQTVSAAVLLNTMEQAAVQGVAVPAFGSAEVEIAVPLENMMLWSSAQPYLYTGTVTVHQNGQALDTVADTFGMRSITVENGKLCLNGENIFLTGALHWGMYWDEYTPACSPQRVEREIEQLQAAGFNAVKFCAVLPPDEVLDVYDRMGMYVYIEYPIWEPRESEAFFERGYLQMMDMVNKDRNHPCVLASDFSCELWSYSFEMEELLKWCVSQAKQEAPNRVYSDASSNGQHKFGDFATAHPYYQQNGFKKQVTTWTGFRNAPTAQPAKYSFYGLSRIKSSSDTPQPVIFGEYADTKVMRSVKQLKETVSENVSWYLDVLGVMDAASILRRTGLEETRIDEIIEASVQSAQEFKRAYIEMAKQNSLMAGLFITHMTDLQAGTAFGLLDDTGTLRYNADVLAQAASETALLLNCESYNFWAGGHYTLGAEISYYSPEDLAGASLGMTLTDDAGRVIESRDIMDDICLNVCDYYPLCEFEVAFPDIAQSARYSLTLSLKQGGALLAQSTWSVWAYPRNTARQANDVYVHDPENLYHLTERYEWMKVYSAGALPNTAMLITTALSDEMLEHARLGGKVIYLGAFGGPMSAAVNWNWDRSAMTYLPDESNEVVADLLSGGYGGVQFNDLMTNAQLTIPTGEACEVVIGKFNYDNAYPSAYLALMRVGEGWLMQSTLRHNEEERALVAGNELNFESMSRPAGENALGLHLLDNMVNAMLRISQ